jgi:hypothetical protein
MDQNDRRCCICDQPIGDGDIALSGLGGASVTEGFLYVHAEDCAGEFLLYLTALGVRPSDG